MDTKATFIQKVHFSMKNDLKAFHYSPSTHAMSSQQQKLKNFLNFLSQLFFANIFQLNSLNYGLLGRLMPGDSVSDPPSALIKDRNYGKREILGETGKKPEKNFRKGGTTGKGLLCWRANNLLLSEFPRMKRDAPLLLLCFEQFSVMQK